VFDVRAPVFALAGFGCALVACRPVPAPKPPSARAPEPSAPSVGQAEPVEWIGLANASYGFVHFGVESVGGLAGRKGSWLLWAVMTPDLDDDDRWYVGSTLRSAGDNATPVPVSREQLRQLDDIGEPPDHIWLVGPDGPCEATVATQAQADHYADGFDTLEIAFSLSGCTGTDWAPVAILDVAPPADVRWETTTRTFAMDDDPDDDATLALVEIVRNEVAEIRAVRDPRTPILYGHVHEIAGTSPRVAETFSGVEWEEPEPEDEDAELPCDTDADWTLVGGVVVGDKLVPFMPLSSGPGLDEPELMGAFVRGPRAHAVIFREGFEFVVFSPATQALSTGQWANFSTGQYHDEIVAAARYRLGGGCEP